MALSELQGKLKYTRFCGPMNCVYDPVSRNQPGSWWTISPTSKNALWAVEIFQNISDRLASMYLNPEIVSIFVDYYLVGRFKALAFRMTYPKTSNFTYSKNNLISEVARAC